MGVTSGDDARLLGRTLEIKTSWERPELCKVFDGGVFCKLVSPRISCGTALSPSAASESATSRVELPGISLAKFASIEEVLFCLLCHSCDSVRKHLLNAPITLPTVSSEKLFYPTPKSLFINLQLKLRSVEGCFPLLPKAS